MIISDHMAEILPHIIQKQPALANIVCDKSLSESQLGPELVTTYRETEDLETRKLIMEFMQEAGYVWLRKLFTRDDVPVNISVAA